MLELKALISKVATGDVLKREEAAEAFDRMMSGEATPSQMGGLLMAFACARGDGGRDLPARSRPCARRMLRVEAPADAIAWSGPAVDASGSYNISTCAAFIIAGAGVSVAKHGNRALSSRCGAADVLATLGVNIELGPEQISRCIKRGRHRASCSHRRIIRP